MTKLKGKAQQRPKLPNVAVKADEDVEAPELPSSSQTKTKPMCSGMLLFVVLLALTWFTLFVGIGGFVAMQNLKEEISNLRAKVNKLGNNAVSPAIAETSDLAKFGSSLDEVRAEISDLRASVDKLATESRTPATAGVSDKANPGSNVNETTAGIDALHAEIEDLRSKVERFKKKTEGGLKKISNVAQKPWNKEPTFYTLVNDENAWNDVIMKHRAASYRGLVREIMELKQYASFIVSQLRQLKQPEDQQAVLPSGPPTLELSRCVYMVLMRDMKPWPLRTLDDLYQCLPKAAPMDIPTWYENSSKPESTIGKVGDIPKIIWQTDKYTDFRHLPNQFAKRKAVFRQLWREFHPDWDYRFLDDAAAKQFMLDHYDEATNRVYDTFPTGWMRGDMLRYALLEKYGGFYADTDSLTFGPIEAWLEPYVAKDPHVIPMSFDEFSSGWFCQWGLISPKGHPIYKSTVQRIVKYNQKTGQLKKDSIPNADTVSRYSGSLIFTQAASTALFGKELTSFDMWKLCIKPTAKCGHLLILQQEELGSLDILHLLTAGPRWTMGVGSFINTFSSQW